MSNHITTNRYGLRVQRIAISACWVTLACAQILPSASKDKGALSDYAQRLSMPADSNLKQSSQPAITIKEEVVRSIEVVGTKYEHGNVISYKVPLLHTTVALWETDSGDKVGMSTTDKRGYEHLEITRDKQGRAIEYTIALPRAHYYDLDGDGRIDAMYDLKTDSHRILVDDTWTSIPNRKNSCFGTEERTTDGRRFVLKQGVWTKTE